MMLLAVLTLFAAPQQEEVKKMLQDLAQGKGELGKLTVTWDDLHGLHGGLRLTVKGDGTVSQEAVREKAGQPKEKVEEKDLKALIDLLVRQEAWVQRVPERRPVPDESRARLTIAYGGTTVTIWEWYNDLDKNKRLGEIRDFMKKIAWK